MKEISIEEKAKRYDSMFERLKEMYNNNKTNVVARLICERYFPELKESEDERIRKVLIQFFKEKDEEDFEEWVPKAKILAWLEKQGGITKLSEEEQNRFAKGVLSNCAMSFIDYLDAHKYEGKMCVSNGECVDIENAFHNDMWDRLHRYYCKYIEKQDEQKPAEWSEEDEDNMTNIEDRLSDYLDYIREDTSLTKHQKNSMKEEVIGYVNWLKSIKERYTWKPSDEQMNALNYVVNLMASSERPTENDLYYNVFKDLREQLKKLKS